MGIFEQFPYTNFHEMNLDWILEELKKIIKTTKINSEEIEKLKLLYTALEKDVKVLEQFKIDFMNGKLTEVYIDDLIEWIDKNVIELVSRVVNYVIPFIDEHGHWCIAVPYNWKFMLISVPMNYEDVYYGRVVLRW